MIGTLIKLALLTIVVLIGLKIFAPEVYEKTTNKISQTTGIDKNKIDSNIDKATDITIKGAEKFTQIAKEKQGEN